MISFPTGQSNLPLKAASTVRAILVLWLFFGLFAETPLWSQEDSGIARLKGRAEEHPEDARLQFNLGVKLLAAKRFEEAVEANQRATEADPKLAQAWYNLGLAFQGLDRWDEAANAYKQATEVKPDYQEAFMNLGASYQHQKMAREAADAYRTAAQLKPDDVEAQFGLAWMLLYLKDDAAASEQYKVLSALDKARADNLYNQYREQKSGDSTTP